MRPNEKFSRILRIATVAAMAGAVLMGASGSSEAADKKDPGKRVYMTKSCMACHGRDGRRAIRDYPNLAAQDPVYMLQQMTDIGSGARVGGADDSGHPRTQGMRDIMHLLSEEEKTQVVEWLGKQAPADVRAPEEPFADGMVEAGATAYETFSCAACHGPDGREPLDSGYPYIAGQKFDYIVNQLTDIRDEVRTNGQTELMLGMVMDATDEDIANMAAYLSQIQR